MDNCLKGLVHTMVLKSKWLAGMTILCFSIALCGCNRNVFKEKKIENTVQASEQEEYSDNIFLMDTYMSLTAYGEHGREAVEKGKKEIERLDKLWSVSNKNGELYALNQKGKEKVSTDTIALLEQAMEISKSTENAFDVTIYPLMELWGFTTGKYKVPDDKDIKKMLANVNQRKISMDKETAQVTLGRKQKIDFGGIAKGYTSNRIMEIWRKTGVTSGMVTLGGNVQVLGKKQMELCGK